MDNVSTHAGISFTAHYTGEMWQKMGLSHPALATVRGKKLHAILKPIAWFSQTFFGVTINKTLIARHQLIDERVTAFIAEYDTVQIVEIAAGLSPRGWRFLQQYDQVSYAEIDLPAMSLLKQERAKNLPKPIPDFHQIDIIADDVTVFFQQLDSSRPVLIITEGLINYFSLDMLAGLSQKLATGLAQFPHSMWITENYPLSQSKNYNRLVNTAGNVLSALTKSSFSFYFTKPNELIEFFQNNGFDQVDIYQPSQPTKTENEKHLGDTVWIMELTS